MTDVRLDVLCDVVSLSGHSVDSSLYVGDVWYGCGWWWWWWRWLLHGGDRMDVCYVACFAKGGCGGMCQGLVESALDAACAKPWRPVTGSSQGGRLAGWFGLVM
jgi:hypothetical protein